jgi:hypothetical protein
MPLIEFAKRQEIILRARTGVAIFPSSRISHLATTMARI